MANPWERNWATSDAVPAAVVAAPGADAASGSSSAPWERNWQAPDVASDPKNSTTESAVEGFLTGAGAGFRDEIYGASKASGLPEVLGGFRAPVGAARLAWEKYHDAEPGEASKTYDAAVDEIRARQKSAQEDHPLAFGTAQVGGSILPASKIMKVAGTGASLGGAIVRSGLAGGVLGGIEGAGNANGGDVTERAIGAAEGAPVGAVVGTAAPSWASS